MKEQGLALLLLAGASAACASNVLAAAQTSTQTLLLKRPVSVVTFSGADRKRFLHGLCTADVTALSAAATNQVADAAIVDPKGSTLSLLTVLDDAPAEELVAYCAADEKIKGATLSEFFDKYVFPADDVEVRDASSSHGSCCYELVGPKACEVLLQAAAAASDGGAASTPTAGCATRLRLFDGELDVLVAGHSSLGYSDGVSLLVLGAADDGEAEAKLTELVQRCGGGVAPSYDEARILRGRPAIGREFGAGAAVEAVPPLSLGLWSAVAPDKGCYLGNEMLARLAKAKVQKRDLYGIALEEEEDGVAASLEIGTEVAAAAEGDEDAAVLGVVTSALPGFALALLKPAAAPIGTPVRCGSAKGKVVDLPFATRQGSASSGSGGGGGDESDKDAADKAAKAAAEAERKAAKLAAMEAKLKALGLKK
jgi:folate-binding Fe-S cluster repair protein YgfZ